MSLKTSTDDVTQASVPEMAFTCPLVSSFKCPVKTNTMQEMVKHINFHMGGQEETEEPMDQDEKREDKTEGSDKKEPQYGLSLEAEEESKEGNPSGKFEDRPREHDMQQIGDGKDKLEEGKPKKKRKQGKVDKNGIGPKQTERKEKANEDEENSRIRSGGRESNVPKAHHMVIYKGYPVKFWLVQLNGMVESAEKNLLDIEHGRTKMKWNRSMYYHWLKREIPDSKNWTKETLRKRTAQIDESSEKFVMEKEPTTEEEKHISSMRIRFNELKESIEKAKKDETELKQAADVSGDKMSEDDEESNDQVDEVNKKFDLTSTKKDVDFYDKAQNIRDASVKKVAVESGIDRRNVAEEEDVRSKISVKKVAVESEIDGRNVAVEEDVRRSKINQILKETDVEKKVSNLVDFAAENLIHPQPTNHQNVYGGIPPHASPYPAMLGHPPGPAYYPSMMPGMYPMGVPMGMNQGVQNQTSRGENLEEGCVPSAGAGGQPMPPFSDVGGPSSSVGGPPAGPGGLPMPPVTDAGGPSGHVGEANGYNWPSGGGWPATGWQMYSPGPGWPMTAAPPNWNRSHFNQTPPHGFASPTGAWPMPNVSGPGWYGLPGFTSNPPGPAEMPLPSAAAVPPVSVPGVIGSQSSEPGPSERS